jgi:flagellar motor switch protein FliN
MTDVSNSFLDLELRAEVWLGAEEVPLERLLELQPGGTLQLSRDPDDPVDLVINGAVVASGELVVVDGKFGFRVTSSSRRELAKLEANGAPSADAPALAEQAPADDELKPTAAPTVEQEAEAGA